jgi:hypothetical protein
MFTVANPFGVTRSWRKCWLIALAFETVVVLTFTTLGVGADNPMPFYLAFALQLPASLAFEPLLGWAQSLGWSEDASLVAACLAVVLIELILVAGLLRAPWRKKLASPNVV